MNTDDLRFIGHLMVCVGIAAAARWGPSWAAGVNLDNPIVWAALFVALVVAGAALVVAVIAVPARHQGNPPGQDKGGSTPSVEENRDGRP